MFLNPHSSSLPLSTAPLHARSSGSTDPLHPSRFLTLGSVETSKRNYLSVSAHPSCSGCGLWELWELTVGVGLGGVLTGT